MKIELLTAGIIREKSIISLNNFLKSNGFIDKDNNLLIGIKDFNKIVRDTVDYILKKCKNCIIINDRTWFNIDDERIPSGSDFFNIIYNKLKKCDFFIDEIFPTGSYPNTINTDIDLDTLDGELMEEIIKIIYKSSSST